jgi:hypothetical protein
MRQRIRLLHRCRLVVLAGIALAAFVLDGCNEHPPDIKRVQRIGSIVRLECADMAVDASSWELVVSRNGDATIRILGDGRVKRLVGVADRLPEIEEILHANHFWELPETLGIPSGLDTGRLLLDVETTELKKKLALGSPWPKSEEGRRAVAIFLFMRGLIADKRAKDQRPEMEEWLKEDFR